MDQKRMLQINDVLDKPYNKATKYLLPMFDSKSSFIFDDEHFVFINVFYKDIDRPYLDNHIFILYEIKACTETVSSYLKIKKLKQYRSSYNFVYNNRTFMVAIFTIPLKYKKDYKNVINGKYSETSIEYKEKVLSYWDINDTNSSTYRILYNLLDTSDNRNLSAAWPDFKAGFGEDEVLPEKPFEDHYHGSDPDDE